MVHRPEYWSAFIDKLAKDGVVSREQSEKWYAPQGAQLFNDIMRKATKVTADEEDERDEDDSDKVSPKLRAWAQLMVMVDPSKSEEEHLYDFINTAHGRSRAQHLNSLSKGEPMLDVRKLIPVIEEGLLAQAKLAKRDGESEAKAFTRIYETDIDFRKQWATVTEAKQLVALAKSVNVMDTTPVSTEVGSGDVEDDSAKAVKQLNDLADKQHRRFEEVFLDPVNAELAARTYRSSTSGSELQW